MSGMVLISGGLGYVGGRMATHFAYHSDFFLRLGTRRAEQPSPHWLARGELVTLDMLDQAQIDAACRGVRHVVHLAAANENMAAADPELSLQVNGLGTLKLLRAAIRAGVERFVYLSTAHIYGSPLVGTISESTLPRPVHPYAITHRTAEDFVLAAHDKGEIVGIALRLSNGFGVPERADVDRWSLIVNDLCRQAVTGGTIQMRSAGLDQRDFISLEDAARAVLHIINLPRAQIGDGLFNVGGGCSMRVIELVELIAQRCHAVLGFQPLVIRPDPTSVAQLPPLDYRMDKLLATGFALQGNMVDEIDATLRLCQAAFSRCEKP